jgi:hypothetical protein
LHQQRDRGDEQRVVGERREELRRHDDVEAEIHDPPGLYHVRTGARFPATAARRFMFQ